MTPFCDHGFDLGFQMMRPIRAIQKLYAGIAHLPMRTK